MATLTINRRKGDIHNDTEIISCLEVARITEKYWQHKINKVIQCAQNCTDCRKNKYTRQQVQTLRFTTTIYNFHLTKKPHSQIRFFMIKLCLIRESVNSWLVFIIIISMLMTVALT